MREPSTIYRINLYQAHQDALPSGRLRRQRVRAAGRRSFGAPPPLWARLIIIIIVLCTPRESNITTHTRPARPQNSAASSLLVCVVAASRATTSARTGAQIRAPSGHNSASRSWRQWAAREPPRSAWRGDDLRPAGYLGIGRRPAGVAPHRRAASPSAVANKSATRLVAGPTCGGAASLAQVWTPRASN